MGFESFLDEENIPLATGPQGSLGELFEAKAELERLQFKSFSDMKVLGPLQTERNEKFKQIRGFNPMNFKKQKLKVPTIGPAKPPFSGEIQEPLDAFEEQIRHIQEVEQYIKEEKEKDPEGLKDVKDIDELIEIVKAKIADAEKVYQDVYSRTRHMPKSAFLTELAAVAKEQFTDEINLALIPFGSSSKSLLRRALVEAGIGVAGEVLQAPRIASWQDQLGQKYTMEEFLTNAGFNAVLGASLPLAGAGIRKTGKNIFRVLKNDGQPRFINTEFDINARKSEVIDYNPLDITEKLPAAERVAKVTDSINAAERAFLRGERIDPADVAISRADLEEAISVDPETLSPLQRELRDELIDIKSNSGDGFETRYPSDEITERAVVSRTDENNNIFMRTEKGDELKLRQTLDEASNNTKLAVGDEFDIRRVDDVSGATKVEVAELAPLKSIDGRARLKSDGLARPGSNLLDPDNPANDLTSGGLGAKDYVSEKEITNPAIGTQGSEAFGVYPDAASIEVQNRIFDEIYSADNMQSLMRQIDEIADDMEIVKADGSVAKAADVKAEISLKTKKQDAFKFCVMGE